MKKCDVDCLPLEHILKTSKKKKMHENWGKSFFCPIGKKMIPPDKEWCIGKISDSAHVSSKLEHST